MSYRNLKPPTNNPTNFDLHLEQSRQRTILNILKEDIAEIKDVLVGSDHREGIVMDVDRLKRSRSMFQATLWVVFTAAIGTTATVIAASFIK